MRSGILVLTALLLISNSVIAAEDVIRFPPAHPSDQFISGQEDPDAVNQATDLAVTFCRQSSIKMTKLSCIRIVASQMRWVINTQISNLTNFPITSGGRSPIDDLFITTGTVCMDAGLSNKTCQIIVKGGIALIHHRLTEKASGA